MLKVITWLLGFLPNSWLVNSDASAQISELLSYMNFFIPFDTAITITTAWLACIFAYFVYSWIMYIIDTVILVPGPFD